MSDPTRVDPITMIIAYLAAASSGAPPEVRAYYAATAREGIRRLDADVAQLKGKLAHVERELVREGNRMALETSRGT